MKPRRQPCNNLAELLYLINVHTYGVDLARLVEQGKLEPKALNYLVPVNMKD